MVTYKALLGEPVKMQGVAKAANGEVLREEKYYKEVSRWKKCGKI